MQVYEHEGRRWISKDDHSRILGALIATADAFSQVEGGQVSLLMRKAVGKGRPLGRGAPELQSHFGKDLPIVQQVIVPLVQSLEGMIPGFMDWMTITGFGNDKDMAIAMVTWSEALAAPRNAHPTKNRAAVKLLSMH